MLLDGMSNSHLQTALSSYVDGIFMAAGRRCSFRMFTLGLANADLAHPSELLLPCCA